MKRKELFAPFLAIFCFSCLILAIIDKVPGEIFGDVIEHMRFISVFRTDGFSLSHWFGGDGPLHTHLAYFFTWLFGFSYLSMKLTSLFAAAVTACCVFFLAWSVFRSRAVAYLALFLCLESFWLMSQAVSAKAHIYAALFSALAVAFYASGRKFLAGLAIGIGFYGQASFWGMAIYSLISLPSLLGFAICFSYFVLTSLFAHGGMFSSGSYLGSKITPGIGGVPETVSGIAGKVLNNIKTNITSLFYDGDPIFRHNVSGASHLDYITAFFLITGILSLLILAFREEGKTGDYVKLSKGRLILYLILPLALSQLSSVLDLESEAANISRMSGSFPFIFLLAGAGIYNSHRFFSRYCKKSALVLFFLAAGISLFINYKRFFYLYPLGLPNQNVPFGRMIYEEFNKMPPETHTYLVDCCWGDAGQPEPDGISFHLSNGRIADFVYPEQIESGAICLEGFRHRHTGALTPIVPGAQYVLAMKPDYTFSKSSLPCMDFEKSEVLERNGQTAAKLIYLRARH